MSDGSRVFLSTLAGAAIGAAAGYLYFTGSGRRFLEGLEPRLDDASREIRRWRGTVNKVQAVATEGWRSLSQIAGEGEQRWDKPRQTSPF